MPRRISLEGFAMYNYFFFEILWENTETVKLQYLVTKGVKIENKELVYIWNFTVRKFLRASSETEFNFLNELPYLLT